MKNRKIKAQTGPPLKEFKTRVGYLHEAPCVVQARTMQIAKNSLMTVIKEAGLLVLPDDVWTDEPGYFIATDEQKKKFEDAVEKAGLVAEANLALPKMRIFSPEGMKEAGISRLLY